MLSLGQYHSFGTQTHWAQAIRTSLNNSSTTTARLMLMDYNARNFSHTSCKTRTKMSVCSSDSESEHSDLNINRNTISSKSPAGLMYPKSPAELMYPKIAACCVMGGVFFTCVFLLVSWWHRIWWRYDSLTISANPRVGKCATARYLMYLIPNNNKKWNADTVAGE